MHSNQKTIGNRRLPVPADLDSVMAKDESFLLKKNDISTTVGILKGSDFGLAPDLLVKRFNYRGFFDLLIHKLFNSRAKRLWKRNLMLYKKGLPVPEPLFYKEASFRRKNAFFLSSVVEDADNLWIIYNNGLFRHDKELLKKLSCTLAEWHLKGAFHGDLKWPNILVQKSGSGYKVFFIDLDQSRLYSAPCIRGIKKDLQRFYRFGLEAGAEGWVDSEFFPAYRSLMPDAVKNRVDFDEIKQKAIKEWIKKGRKRLS
jgi:tRNA A-37 threonylcarbamoyl transferase component Bud32